MPADMPGFGPLSAAALFSQGTGRLCGLSSRQELNLAGTSLPAGSLEAQTLTCLAVFEPANSCLLTSMLSYQPLMDKADASILGKALLYIAHAFFRETPNQEHRCNFPDSAS